jgi:hypothetical protein
MDSGVERRVHDGSSPDPTKWIFDTGGNGWGNNELEYYTARPQNAKIQNGNLVITAIQEMYTGPDGVTRNYTSARLKTAGLFSQTYGRFEARIKIPYGQGIWPAFWMLGNDIATNVWPACGEIDIMENIGSEPATVHGSMHGHRGIREGMRLLAATVFPPGISATITTCLPWSGKPTSFASTWTTHCMRRELPATSPAVRAGYLIIHFLFC